MRNESGAFVDIMGESDVLSNLVGLRREAAMSELYCFVDEAEKNIVVGHVMEARASQAVAQARYGL